MFGKKRLNPSQFAGNLLALRRTIEEKSHSLFVNELGFQGDDETLHLEVQILSLWIITLAVPDDQYRDLIHMSFCVEAGFSKEETDLFYQEVDKRYRTYFEAYNMWMKTKDGGVVGGAIGGAITEIILNGNVEYSPRTDPLPLGLTTNWRAFTLFSGSFETTLDLIGKLKRKYKIEGM